MSEPRGQVVGFPPGGRSGAGSAGFAAPMGPPLGPPGGPLGPAPMMLNPAFVQWRQLAQAWQAETQRRRQEFLHACHLIRHDVQNGYAIDIEADSTIAADEQAEKASRTEFLQSALPMLQLLIPQAMQNKALFPLIHALVMFGVRAFPTARSLELQFEQAFRLLARTDPPPPPPKGNVKTPAEIMAEQQTAQGEQQIDQQKNQIDAAQVQVAQQKNAIMLYEAFLKMQAESANQQQDAAFKNAQLAQRSQELDDRRDLTQARLTHLLSRDTSGLV